MSCFFHFFDCSGLPYPIPVLGMGLHPHLDLLSNEPGHDIGSEKNDKQPEHSLFFVLFHVFSHQTYFQEKPTTFGACPVCTLSNGVGLGRFGAGEKKHIYVVFLSKGA